MQKLSVIHSSCYDGSILNKKIIIFLKNRAYINIENIKHILHTIF